MGQFVFIRCFELLITSIKVKNLKYAALETQSSTLNLNGCDLLIGLLQRFPKWVSDPLG